MKVIGYYYSSVIGNYYHSVNVIILTTFQRMHDVNKKNVHIPRMEPILSIKQAMEKDPSRIKSELNLFMGHPVGPAVVGDVEGNYSLLYFCQKFSSKTFK